MQWKMVEDRKPKVGAHIFMLGQNNDGQQWFWWGFYNPKRKDGCPIDNPIYWCEMPPLPIMPEIKKEVEDDAEMNNLNDSQSLE